jgi:hypothetical protein
MKASLRDALKRLPGAPSDTCPEGVDFCTVMAGGSMRVEAFAPGSNADDQDRHSGIRRTSCILCSGGKVRSSSTGSVLTQRQGTYFLWPRAPRTVSKTSANIL